MTGGVVRLGPEHDRSAFDSGEPALDRWLREHAGQADRKDSARTYVVCDGERVIGYYSVCAYSVDWDGVPTPVRVGRHPVPAVLIARLAVDTGYHGQGLGTVLLVDAITRVVRVADEIAARIVVVDAMHDTAAAFYERHGFRPFDQDHPLSLYLTVKDIRRTLDAVLDV